MYKQVLCLRNYQSQLTESLRLTVLVLLELLFSSNLDIFMAVLCNRAGQYISVLWFLQFSFFFPRLFSAVADWMLPYFHTWCGLSANLGCRSETCCTRLAKNTRRKKSPKIRHLRTITQLCPAMSSQLRHVSTIGKNLLNSNISPTCHHNMVNLSPLPAEIGSLVGGTPANFNRFRVLASLLHRHRSTE